MKNNAEASIAHASGVLDIRSLDQALAERTRIISPKRRQNHSLAVILGMGLPLPIIVLADFINNKITAKSQVDKNSNVLVLCNTGQSKFATDTGQRESPR